MNSFDGGAAFLGGGPPRTPFRSPSGFSGNHAQQQTHAQSQQPAHPYSTGAASSSFSSSPFGHGQQVVQGVGQSSPMTSGELYASPFASSGLARASSFRSSVPRRSTSGEVGRGGAGFGYSQFDTANSPSPSVPKSVRWDDAPQSPSQGVLVHGQGQQQQQQPYPQSGGFGAFSTSTSLSSQRLQAHPTSSSSPSSSYNSWQVNHQGSVPSYAMQQQSAQNPYQLSNSQTSSHPRYPSSASSAQQSSNPPSNAVSSWSSPQAAQQSSQATRSAFSSSPLASLTKPIAMSSLSARAITNASSASRQTSAAPSNSGTSGARTAASQSQSVVRGSVITPRSAVVARVKWNLIALLLIWLLPSFGPISAAYWLALNATFDVLGGEADVHLALILSWARRACFVVTLANLVEATIRLQTSSSSPTSSEQADLTAQGTLQGTKRKPSLAHPPSRIPSSSSSPSQPASTSSSTTTKRDAARHYAHASPLRESIFRASVSAQQQNSLPALDVGPRMPTQTPSRFEGIGDSLRRSSRSSSPAAAFLARKQERMASGGALSSLGDQTFDGDLSGSGGGVGTIGADLSNDSIEVNRAIRALSASYGRELSSDLRSSPASSSNLSRQAAIVG